MDEPIELPADLLSGLAFLGELWAITDDDLPLYRERMSLHLDLLSGDADATETVLIAALTVLARLAYRQGADIPQAITEAVEAELADVMGPL